MKFSFKYLFGIATLFLLFTIFVSSPAKPVAAQTIPYNYAYNATNLYADDVIYYEFTGLDSSLTYTWTIKTADLQDNDVDVIGIKTVSGVTTTNWFFGVSVVGVNDGSWPEGYVGPIHVEDNFGNTIGKHFVAQKPLTPDNTDEWETSGGTFNFQEKQVVGNGNPNTDGTTTEPCMDVVNNAINSDGFHHGFLACQSTTSFGDFALLHFQFDPTSYTPGNEIIKFYNLSLGSGSNLTLTISEDDICEYQVVASSGTCTSSFISTVATFTAFDSFVIIQTGPGELPFVNYQVADAAFTSDGSLNPMRWGRPRLAAYNGLGAYGCVRYVATVATSDCESIWLVSNDGSPEAPTSTEWDVKLSHSVKESGIQTVTITQDTEQIWDSFHGAYDLLDVYSGVADTTIYAFAAERQQSYTVNSTAANNVTVAFYATPLFLPTDAVSATPADMKFATLELYNIIPSYTPGELIETNLDNWGLNTELGRTVAQITVIIFALICTAFIPRVRENVISYLVVWTFIGGLWTVAGLGSTIGSLMFGIITIFLWFMALTTFRDQLTGFGNRDEIT